MTFKIKALCKTPAILLDADLRQQSGVISALGKEGIPIIAVSSLNDCPAFHSRFVSERVVSPRFNDDVEVYIDFLCGLETKGILIYSCDANALVISKYQDKLKKSGFFLNIPDPVLLESLFDKWLCYKLLHNQIPMAKTCLVNSVEDIYRLWDDFTKPVILKGTRLAGGSYSKIMIKDQIIESFKSQQALIDAEDNRTRNSGLILQEWLTYGMNDMWACETVYDQKSNPQGFFTINKIRSSLDMSGSYTSRLFAGEYVQSEELIGMTKKILSLSKWKGFAHVEFFYVPTKKRFYLTELNPRLPGFSYYPSKAGLNMAYCYYADLAGIDYSPSNNFSASVYFESFMYPGDLTQSFFYILKKHIKFSHFILSYLKLLKPSVVKIVEPIRLEDPKFTLFSFIDSYKYFMSRVYSFLRKKIRLLRRI